MSFVAWFVAAIAIVSFGLAAWVWLAIANANDDLLSFLGFEGMHFED